MGMLVGPDPDAIPAKKEGPPDQEIPQFATRSRDGVCRSMTCAALERVNRAFCPLHGPVLLLGVVATISEIALRAIDLQNQTLSSQARRLRVSLIAGFHKQDRQAHLLPR